MAEEEQVEKLEQLQRFRPAIGSQATPKPEMRLCEAPEGRYVLFAHVKQLLHTLTERGGALREAELWRCSYHGLIEPSRFDGEWERGAPCPVLGNDEEPCGEPLSAYLVQGP